jgi:hypothetical protein
MLAGVVIWFDRGSAAQFYAAIFISIVFLLLDTVLRPYYDFRCNALKTLVSTSMVITLLCGLCSKLDPESEIIGESTLGWTLVVVNGIIVLLVLCLELIRRALSVARGVRSGISYLKNTQTVCPLTGVESYEGEYRQSAEDEPVVAIVKAYPLHTYPDARLVHSKLQALGFGRRTGGSAVHLCPVYGCEMEHGVLFMATKPSTTTLSKHIALYQTCPIAAQEFCSTVTNATLQLHTAGQSSWSTTFFAKRCP